MNKIFLFMLLLLISSGSMAQKTKTVKVDGVKFKMIYVPGGTFLMGGYGDIDEKPIHWVTLSGYYIGETNVTEELWNTVMTGTKSGSSDYIKWGISYNQCQNFITKLNQKTGLKFRMPTEAEWEYAAIGGDPINYGSRDVNTIEYSKPPKWCKDHTPNGYGIWYMLGAWVWCQDYYGRYSAEAVTNPQGPTSGEDRVLRGGYHLSYKQFDPKYRTSLDPTESTKENGLRLAMSYEGKKKK